MYQKAGCGVEVAQMLLEERLMQRLADYTRNSTDRRKLLRLLCDQLMLDKARAVVAKLQQDKDNDKVAGRPSTWRRTWRSTRRWRRPLGTCHWVLSRGAGLAPRAG